MIKSIVIGFFCFLLFFLHTFIFHNFNIKRRFYFIVKVFFCVLPVYVVLFAVISENQMQRFVTILLPITLFAFLNGTFLHFFFYHFYLHLIQIIDRSPSTRIMIEIESSPEKTLTLEQIKELYSMDRTISDKLEDMIILGRLNKKSNFYIITPKGKMHMRIFKFIRDYLGLRRS